MINEEVKHIIEPELQEGEELLWAETVSQTKITEHLKYLADESNYERRINGPLCIILYFVLFIFTTWVSLMSFAVIFFVLFIVSVFSHIHYMKAENPHKSDFPGAYALTNLRLFTFDSTLSTWASKDASNLKSAYEETIMLRLKPVGSSFFKTERLAHLASNYRTANYINSKIES